MTVTGPGQIGVMVLSAGQAGVTGYAGRDVGMLFETSVEALKLKEDVRPFAEPGTAVENRLVVDP